MHIYEIHLHIDSQHQTKTAEILENIFTNIKRIICYVANILASKPSSYVLLISQT